MSTQIVTREPDALAFIEQPSPEALQAALAEGQLQKLSTEQRLNFLAATCRSLGLNPLSRPFEFLSLQGKIIMYARKDATDQLRKLHNVSIKIASREQVGDVLVVTAHASLPNGREDEAVGAVPFGNIKGEAAAMAFMKAETKAKRRVTLSICGLGFMDESEIEDAQAAQHPRHESPTMPATAEVSVKASPPSLPEAKPKPAPKEELPFIEAEPVDQQDPDMDLLTDFLTVINETTEAKDLTNAVSQAGTFKKPAHVKTAKRAIQARADALGLEWSADEKAFIPIL